MVVATQESIQPWSPERFGSRPIHCETGTAGHPTIAARKGLTVHKLALRKRRIVTRNPMAKPNVGTIFARATIKLGLQTNNPRLVKAGRALLRRSEVTSAEPAAKSENGEISAQSLELWGM